MRKVLRITAVSFLFVFCVIFYTGRVYASEKKAYVKDDFLAGHLQTVYNDSNGLDVNEINDICQTADGYIWIASYSGLIRYDGKEFELFNSLSEQPIPANGIICVAEDSEGRLWIGSNDNGLLKMENGEFVKLQADGTGQSIRELAEDSAGTVYAATTEGIGYINAEEKLVPIGIAEFDQVSAQNLAIDGEDRLWVITASGEIIVAADGKLFWKYTPDKTKYGVCTGIYADADGRVYAGTDAGFILQFQETEGRVSLHTAASADGMKQINGFFRDKENKLWVCGDNGIGYLDEKEQLVQLEDTLINYSIERIVQDQEGSYWAASSRQGILKLSKSKFYNIGLASDLSKSVVNSTLMAWGKLFIASDSGLLVLNNQGEKIDTEIGSLLEGIRLRHLYLDDSNQVWISTYESYGVVCVRENGTYTYYNEENSGLSSNQVRSVLECEDGTIAVATNSGIDIIDNEKIVTSFGLEEGLKNPVILSMCEGPDGLLYAGSDGNGIYVIDKEGGLIEHISPEEGLSTGVILRMAVDPQQKGIFISTGNQLDYYDFKSQRCEIAENMPLSTSNIFDIQFIEDNKMLILTAKNMVIVETGEAKEQNFIEIYDRNSGLSSTITANSWSCLTKEGELYLCLNPGINAINVYDVQKNMEAPKTVIKQIEADGKKLDLMKPIMIPANSSRITIEFALLSYVERSRTSVTYELVGFDRKPVVLMGEEETAVSYTNLPGGVYTFRISAENGDGAESIPVSITIKKQKVLTEYPAFWLGIVGAAALTVITVTWICFNVRTKKIMRQQESYRRITEQSLRTIANTIDAKDENTNGHSVRVADYARALAKRMQMTQEEQEQVYYSALLHDIGKIGIPDAILNKPGKLTAEEFEVMRSHVEIGGDILKDFKSIPEIHEVVRTHHENFDGGGYPYGLRGSDICLSAQIIRVADAYDAMASLRSYRKPMNQEYIISELEKFSGIQFNPEIAELMIQIILEKNGDDSL